MPTVDSNGPKMDVRKLGMMGVIGATLGVILGILTIVTITWRDTKVRTKEDLGALIETPIIVEVPHVKYSEKKRPLLLKVAMGLIPRATNSDPS